MALKNITITLPQESAHWVRIKAAEANTSVAKYIGRLLQREMSREQNRPVERDESYWQAYEEWKKLTHPVPGVDASKRGPRSEIYDRQIMRGRKIED